MTDLQQLIAIAILATAFLITVVWIDPDDLGGTLKGPGGFDAGFHFKRNGRRRPVRRRRKPRA